MNNKKRLSKNNHKLLQTARKFQIMSDWNTNSHKSGTLNKQSSFFF